MVSHDHTCQWSEWSNISNVLKYFEKPKDDLLPGLLCCRSDLSCNRLQFRPTSLLNFPFDLSCTSVQLLDGTIIQLLKPLQLQLNPVKGASACCCSQNLHCHQGNSLFFPSPIQKCHFLAGYYIFYRTFHLFQKTISIGKEASLKK